MHWPARARHLYPWTIPWVKTRSSRRTPCSRHSAFRNLCVVASGCRRLTETQINDVLLTALTQAFEQWTGEPSLRLDVEGHGREDIFEGLDVSQTVGWFTSLFTVHLDLTGLTQPGESLKSVKEQLRAIPNRGIGYGLLRYLSTDDRIRGQLEAIPQAEVTFNYLGQFSPALPADYPVAAAKESFGSLSSPRERRPALLDINGGVSDGQLQFAWTYSVNISSRIDDPEAGGKTSSPRCGH